MQFHSIKMLECVDLRLVNFAINVLMGLFVRQKAYEDIAKRFARSVRRGSAGSTVSASITPAEVRPKSRLKSH